MPTWISTISQNRRGSRQASEIGARGRPVLAAASHRGDSGTTMAMAMATRIGAAQSAATPRHPSEWSRVAEAADAATRPTPATRPRLEVRGVRQRVGVCSTIRAKVLAPAPP